MDHKKDGLAFLQGQVSDDCKVNIKEFSMLQTKFSTIGGSLQGRLIFLLSDFQGRALFHFSTALWSLLIG